MSQKPELSKEEIIDSLDAGIVRKSFLWADLLAITAEQNIAVNVHGFYHDQEIEPEELIQVYEKNGDNYLISYPALDRLNGDTTRTYALSMKLTKVCDNISKLMELK